MKGLINRFLIFNVQSTAVTSGRSTSRQITTKRLNHRQCNILCLKRIGKKLSRMNPGRHIRKAEFLVQDDRCAPVDDRCNVTFLPHVWRKTTFERSGYSAEGLSFVCLCVCGTPSPGWWRAFLTANLCRKKKENYDLMPHRGEKTKKDIRNAQIISNWK